MLNGRTVGQQKHKKTAAVTSQWGTYGIISDSEFVILFTPRVAKY